MFIITQSCDKEPLIYEYSIEPALEVYVNSFFTEAAKRNIALDKSNLIIRFVEDSADKYCGQCTKPKKNKQGQREILIWKSRECWEIEPYENKEALIFHELGHCLLNREHLDAFFPSGAPKTIMTTIIEGPYQPCIYVFGDTPEDVAKCNLTTRRSYYLDELFDPQIKSIPSWAN